MTDLKSRQINVLRSDSFDEYAPFSILPADGSTNRNFRIKAPFGYAGDAYWEGSKHALVRDRLYIFGGHHDATVAKGCITSSDWIVGCGSYKVR